MTTLTFTEEQQRALDDLARHGDSILKATFANTIAEAFGLDIEPYVYANHDGAKIDLSVRAEFWEEGLCVNACSLAQGLVDHLKVERVDYDTDYIGMGKRTRALTAQAVISLRVAAGEHYDRCEMCGTYDLPGGYGDLCFGCHRDLRDDYEANISSSKVRRWPNGAPIDGIEVTEWWVASWPDRNYKTFDTRGQARAWAQRCREFQAATRERYA